MASLNENYSYELKILQMIEVKGVEGAREDVALSLTESIELAEAFFRVCPDQMPQEIFLETFLPLSKG